MRQDDIWDIGAARRYDTPGTGMFAPEVLGPTIDRLAELAGDGRALELAIGTGRVAVPLAERSVPGRAAWSVWGRRPVKGQSAQRSQSEAQWHVIFSVPAVRCSERDWSRQ